MSNPDDCSAAMRIFDHEPEVWFLLDYEGSWLLEVNCSHAAVGYSVLIPLSSEETESLWCHGRAALNELAAEVQRAGPGSELQRRDMTSELQQEVDQALREWRETRETLELEKAGLIQEINEAFANVSRLGGISWRDALLADAYGDGNFVTYIDRDRTWMDLVADQNWDPGFDGGFSFLDAIGFRYYLPAALMRSIENGWDEGVSFHLTVYKVGHERRDYRLAQLSLLSKAQYLCVQRFLKYMMARTQAQANEIDQSDWAKAYSSFWDGRCAPHGKCD